MRMVISHTDKEITVSQAHSRRQTLLLCGTKTELKRKRIKERSKREKRQRNEEKKLSNSIIVNSYAHTKREKKEKLTQLTHISTRTRNHTHTQRTTHNTDITCRHLKANETKRSKIEIEARRRKTVKTDEEEEEEEDEKEGGGGNKCAPVPFNSSFLLVAA